MKKFFVILICLAMVCGVLTACTESGTQTSSEASESVAETSAGG